MDRRFQELDIRRDFTVFQLMTILEEARHSLIVIEHDPLFYEDAQEETAVLLYSPRTDTFLEDMIRNADRVLYFDEEQRARMKLISKAYPKAEKSQIIIEAWTCSNCLWKREARPLEPKRCRPKAHGAETAKKIVQIDTLGGKATQSSLRSSSSCLHLSASESALSISI